MVQSAIIRLAVSMAMVCALCVGVMVDAQLPPATCPGQSYAPDLLFDFALPTSGILPDFLVNYPANVLVLDPIAPQLFTENAVKSTVEAYTVYLGPPLNLLGERSCSGSCPTGTITVGLYHLHPNPVGPNVDKVHLVGRSDPFPYDPNTIEAGVYNLAVSPNADHNKGKVPFPTYNPFSGYFMAIIGTVPYSVLTDSDVPVIPIATGPLANPEKDGGMRNNIPFSDFLPVIADPSYLGFYYCPAT